MNTKVQPSLAHALRTEGECIGGVQRYVLPAYVATAAAAASAAVFLQVFLSTAFEVNNSLAVCSPVRLLVLSLMLCCY